MTRRINKLQINAQEASNNQILVARGGALVFDDASNVFVGDSQEANAAQTANFANTAGFANVSLEANFANTAGFANVSLLANFANTAGFANVSLEANFANTAGFANVSLLANVANTVVTLSNFTTDNLAESAANLYFTNTRVVSALVAGDNIEIESNGRISAIIANVSFANTVQTISNFTTEDLAEGNVNLYYTNSRVRSAFSPGIGITITSGGIIAATDSRPTFNLNTDGSISYTITNTMSNVVVFPQNADTTLRYALKSIHVTNLSEDTAHISGNFVFSSGNTVPFADFIPIPYGASAEFIKREQGFGQLGAVQLQGFDKDRIPTSNIISATLTYETLYFKEGIVGSGLTMLAGNVEYELWNSLAFFTIVESIKLVNLDDTTVRARVTIADANNTPLSYLAYNLALPAKTIIEILQSSKRINFSNKVITALNSDANVSAIISLRKGGEVNIGNYTETPSAGGNVELEFNTNLPEGTQVYYTIE